MPERPNYRILSVAFFALSGVLAVIAAALGFIAWGGAAGGGAEEPAPTAVVSEIYTTPEPTPTPVPTPEPTATPEPTPEPTPVPTATPEPTATPWPGPVVPEQEQPMGAEYFANAAFLGNSVTSGLWYYDSEDLLPNGQDHWYWANSLTIWGAPPYVSQMPANSFGKVYIGFGINEVSSDRDSLRTAFNSVIDQIQASQPNAIIYLMSVAPVSKWCDANRPFKRADVLSFNDMLRDIAAQRQVWYLDVYPALCGEDGYLPSNVTADGVHFNAGHYQYWFDYMKTHYVPDGTPAATEPPASPAPVAANG